MLFFIKLKVLRYSFTKVISAVGVPTVDTHDATVKRSLNTEKRLK